MNKNFFSTQDKNAKSIQIKKSIINFFINEGNNTITELSKELDLSIPTITKFINELSDQELIMEYGKVQTSGGRYPILYGLKPDSIYFLGADLGRHHLNIALMNFKGELTDIKMGIKYSFENTPESFNILNNLIQEFIDNLTLHKDRLFNLNINISGRVNPETGHSYSNFYFSEQPITEILSEKLHLSVGIDNDTRAMALGEYMSGTVEGEKDVIFVNISWGTGIGIIIDGKPYYGKSGFAGEFGHIPAFENEIICHCGKKGCLETEASGLAIHRMIIERVKNGESSILSEKVKDIDSLTLRDILDAVKKEDPLSIEIVEQVGTTIGKHIAGLINIFNPELVIIGGEVSEAEDFLLLPIKSSIRKHSLSLVNKDSKIVVSKLKQKAGIVGACMVARSRLFDNNNIDM